MINTKNTIEKFKKINKALQLEKNYSDEAINTFHQIEACIEKKLAVQYKLPVLIKNFLTYSDHENSLELLINPTFIPFNINNYYNEFQQILNDFDVTIPGHSPIILSEYGEQKIFDGTEDWENEENKYIALQITNPYHFLPLFNGGFGSFIFYDISNAQLIFADQLEWRVLAPNMDKHIEDLISGISQSKYEIDMENEVIDFPLSWFLRKNNA